MKRQQDSSVAAAVGRGDVPVWRLFYQRGCGVSARSDGRFSALRGSPRKEKTKGGFFPFLRLDGPGPEGLALAEAASGGSRWVP
jgi:hypothetical protein